MRLVFTRLGYVMFIINPVNCSSTHNIRSNDAYGSMIIISENEVEGPTIIIEEEQEVVVELGAGGGGGARRNFFLNFFWGWNFFLEYVFGIFLGEIFFWIFLGGIFWGIFFGWIFLIFLDFFDFFWGGIFFFEFFWGLEFFLEFFLGDFFGIFLEEFF